MEGYLVERTAALEDIMVDVAQGVLNHLDVANIFSSLAAPFDVNELPEIRPE
jgi:death-on-curing protein